MEGGEEKAEEGGDTLSAESGISGADFDRIRITVPARLDTRRHSLRHIVPASASKPYKTITSIFFSSKRTDRTAKARYKTIKKAFGRLIDFIF